MYRQSDGSALAVSSRNRQSEAGDPLSASDFSLPADMIRVGLIHNVLMAHREQEQHGFQRPLSDLAESRL
jgi:hypothetical protein